MEESFSREYQSAIEKDLEHIRKEFDKEYRFACIYVSSVVILAVLVVVVLCLINN